MCINDQFMNYMNGTFFNPEGKTTSSISHASKYINNFEEEL